MSIQQEIQGQRAMNMQQAIDELRHLLGILNKLEGEAYEMTIKRVNLVLNRMEELTNTLKLN